MVRMALADLPLAFLEFDLPGRTLTLGHQGEPGAVLARLLPLGYGGECLDSQPLMLAGPPMSGSDALEAAVLWRLLAINALMFGVEVLAGWWADSAGLLADAADMFADALVYGVALFAVGRPAARKLQAARFSGALQLLLGLAALAETGRRVFAGSVPEERAMISIALLALAANVACLLMIARHRERGAHMQASYIFSANDVLANLGVILAGGLVAWTGSPLPDWIIGGLIACLVLIGALRILRLR